MLPASGLRTAVFFGSSPNIRATAVSLARSMNHYPAQPPTGDAGSLLRRSGVPPLPALRPVLFHRRSRPQ